MVILSLSVTRVRFHGHVIPLFAFGQTWLAVIGGF